MLVPMKVILDDANKNCYAVAAINVINMELARGVITAAMEEHAPLIINIGEGQMTKHGWAELMVPMIRHLANNVSIPIALNLDHGKNFNIISHAFRNGFTSIIIDASQYDIEENIRRTKEVVRLARTHGVTIEAELGHVGQAVDSNGNNAMFYTRLEDVEYFMESTEVDALAVAVGTAHGRYPSGYTPTLQFDLIRDIKAVRNMPLVLHGGSGSGDDNIARAVEARINKVNICTDVFNAARDYICSTLQNNPDTDFLQLMIDTEKAIKIIAKHYIMTLHYGNLYLS